jgi:acyl-CoA reductase-like NAD-dependent aldehyde dehydrogenase
MTSKPYELFIANRWRPSADGSSIPSVNPATEENWASFAAATSEDVDDAVVAAHNAFEDGPWPRMAPRDRAKTLRRIADRIPSVADHLGSVETTDTGKLLRETQWQARNLSEVFNFYAGLTDTMSGAIAPVGYGQPMGLVLREPVGVVAAIVPWNSQLHLSAFKAAPALAAGCTMVLKPSEQASAAVLEFARIVAEADLPPGVFNVVTGNAYPCGDRLTSHPLVRRISFTGGIDTARKIIPNTANNIARMSLELGGKSPVIVFDDVDLESAVNGVTAGIFAASGQSCAAGSRLILHEKIYDRFLELLIKRARNIRIGDPMDAKTEMGPLATKGQLDRIERHLAKSLEQGARVLTGGAKPPGFDRGYYFEPTIVECDGQDIPVATHELFGPVLSVLRFKDEAEAIKIANNSRYAFAGGLFTRDLARAMRVVREVRAGRLWVNTYRLTSLFVPFGGFKESGYGREAGLDAIRDYTDTKGVFIDISGQPVADPFIMK